MGEAEWELAQDILVVVIRVTMPILLAWIGNEARRYLVRLRQYKGWREIERIVKDAVTTAEKLELDHRLYDYADSKFDYVLDVVGTWSIRNGVDLEWVELVAIIEAEVERQFPKLGAE